MEINDPDTNQINKIALYASAFIALLFVVGGVFDILDYFIIKTILFLTFIGFSAYIILQIVRR